MKFEDMSEEAQEAAKSMIDFCVRMCYCMGMDEGTDVSTGEDHEFVKELKRFMK